LRRPPVTLHGVVFDVFDGRRGDPARRHHPEGAQAFQVVAQTVGFGLERSKVLDLSIWID
jgi:hypothetical protein